jgi:hypothetical protein
MCETERNEIHTFYSENLKGNEHLEEDWCRWEDTIKMEERNGVKVWDGAN